VPNALEVLRPAFAALRWLNMMRFGDCADIAAAISELESQAEALAGMPLLEPNPSGVPASRCPACSARPVRPGKYDPIPYCLPCLQVIMPGLTKCRQRFGTDAI
jgi:hypothetical protein